MSRNTQTDPASDIISRAVHATKLIISQLFGKSAYILQCDDYPGRASIKRISLVENSVLIITNDVAKLVALVAIPDAESNATENTYNL